MSIDDEGNLAAARALADCLDELHSSVGRVAELAGVSRSTLYRWAAGDVVIPVYAPRRLARALKQMHHHELAQRLVAEMVGTRELGFVVAPQLRPKDIDDLRDAGLRMAGAVGDAASFLRKSLADGRLTAPEKDELVQLAEAVKRDAEGVAQAAEAAVSLVDAVRSTR